MRMPLRVAGRQPLPGSHPPGGRSPVMDDLTKLALFLIALYGAYHSARTAWRLGTELLS